MTRTLWIGALIVVAGSAVAMAGAEEAPQPFLERAGLTFDVADEVRYDDNILEMSDEDIRRLADNPNSSRFRISTPDDWINHASFDVRWTPKLFPRRETRFFTGADIYRFRRNAIKNWDEYHVGMIQELTASRKHLLALRVGAVWISDYYLRELTDDDASFAAGTRIRKSARYDQASPFASIEWEIIDDRLTMSLDYKRARRNYVDDFNERDGIRTDWSLEARVRPIKSWRFEIEAGASTGEYDARGDLDSTPIPDDDISYDHDGGWLKATIPWGTNRRGRVEVGIEIEHRDFTTPNMFDLFHFGRTDTRRTGGVRVAQRLSRVFELIAEWRYESNNSDFAAGVVPRDDVTDFTDNRYDLGLRARFGP